MLALLAPTSQRLVRSLVRNEKTSSVSQVVFERQASSEQRQLSGKTDKRGFLWLSSWGLAVYTRRVGRRECCGGRGVSELQTPCPVGPGAPLHTV